MPQIGAFAVGLHPRVLFPLMVLVVGACGNNPTNQFGKATYRNAESTNKYGECIANMQSKNPEADALRDFREGRKYFLGVLNVGGDGPLVSYYGLTECTGDNGKYFKSVGGLDRDITPNIESAQTCRTAEERYIARYNIAKAKMDPRNLQGACGPNAEIYPFALKGRVP